jgi:rubrerythrin
MERDTESLRFDRKEEARMKKWRCKICGYVHEGENPPDKCPICGATKDRFELIE